MTARRPRARLRHAAIALAGLVAVAAVALGDGPVAGAQSDMGTATIRSRSGQAIEGGGSATQFTIDLPDGAQCPGDSANDDYRVGSYMLPATVDPFDVEWSGEGPDPYGLGDYETFRQPLYDDLTSGFSSKLLAENDGPGKPGQILDFPAFSLAVFEPGMIPPGRYRIGIVCNLYAEVTDVWNAEIEVTTDPQDAPAQISWTVVGSTSTGSSSSLPAAPVLVVLVLGVAAVAVLLLILRARRPSPSTTRHDPTR